jgi:hypothetical protein
VNYFNHRYKVTRPLILNKFAALMTNTLLCQRGYEKEIKDIR